LGPGRVVLGQLGDLLEQLATPPVVEPSGRQRLGPAGQPGPGIGCQFVGGDRRVEESVIYVDRHRSHFRWLLDLGLRWFRGRLIARAVAGWSPRTGRPTPAGRPRPAASPGRHRTARWPAPCRCPMTEPTASG